MKSRPSLIVACIAAISLLSACNRPSVSEGAGVPPTEAPPSPTEAPPSPTQAPDTQIPVVEITAHTECYTGPGPGYYPVHALAPGQGYEILGIDDDIAWIDDDIAWFQIDPTALIDPDPPHRPLAEADQQPEMRLHCWVPDGGVEISGDLSQVPPFPIPTVLISRDANCRSGPTTEYRVLGFLPLGGRYAVFGRNRGGNAWLVYDPAIRRTCWVHGSLVEMTGDTGLANVVEPPPPEPIPPTEGPASRPVDCSQYSTDPTGCGNNPACWWDSSVPPNGVCKNK